MSRRNLSNNRRSAKTQKRIAGHLEKINLFAAGIDIGSKSHYVAVPEELELAAQTRHYDRGHGIHRRLLDSRF